MKHKVGKTISIYWKYASRHKPLFFFIFIASSIAAALNSIIPLYLKRLLDLIAGSEISDEIYKSALWILAFMAIFEIGRWAFNRMASFSEIRFLARTIAEISVGNFSYLHKHSLSFFTNNFSGSLVKKMNYFTRALEMIVDSLCWSLVPLFVNMSIIISVLFWRNWLLGLGVLLWMILFYTITFFFSRWKYKYDVIANEAISKTTGFLADTITNSANVKLFNGYKREVGQYSALHEDLRKKNLFAWNMEEFFNSITSFMMIALEVGLFFMAVILWRQGIFTAGDFVMIQAYVIMLIMQGWHFGRTIRHLYRAFSDSEEMTEILLKEHQITNHPRAKKLKVDKGGIELNKVSFNYKKTRKIFDHFDLNIDPGEKVALIGPSGAGKTTIVKLLLRNYDISGGSILIDGQDIAKCTLESLWRAISLVPQDPILFHRTLMENIRYGRPSASDKEVIEASKKAHCHEFISELSEGYDTYVGERGIKLSGGERQRVAIARAILRNSPILVLDEATSSLDSQSEIYIQDALDKLMKDKTVIVIAHRLSTIKKMDRIIFIDEGKIQEDGTHDELSRKKNGHYAHLWELQAGGFIE
ncbi:ATP-binding cassette domain-containing protein [Candidatus Falkowbacteria bacterium]|nr:ATP-binding cassette domain-containing protein [Candidatus Falkowbacteria bacterium]